MFAVLKTGGKQYKVRQAMFCVLKNWLQTLAKKSNSTKF